MTTPAVPSTTAAPAAAATPTATSTPPAAATATGGLDTDAFLQLLVAQLRYQNPLEPSDPQQQLAQLATFAQVERLDQVLEATTQMLAYSRATAGQAYLGSEVEGLLPDGSVVSGVVTGLQLTGGEPALVLADGSTLPVAAVTVVGARAATTAAGASAAPAAPTPGATDSDPAVPGTAPLTPGESA